METPKKDISFSRCWRLEIQDEGSSQSPLPGSWMTVFPLCPHVAEGVRQLSRVYFLPHDLISHLPKAHLLAASQWGLGFQPMNWRDTNIRTLVVHPGLPKSMSCSREKYTHYLSTAPKVLTHSSITLKYKVSFKYPLNQIQVRFQVQLFPRQFFSPPVKPDKLKVSKVHWWDNGRIDILILKGRNRKKAMMSPKPVQNLAKQIPLDLKV